jgi:two-component system, NtrC family, sensor histidine kinase GlrK
MRLVNRLILSHAMLAVVLVAALGVMLATLSDIHSQVREVRERDLATIDEEEEIHRAAWAIEVTARHSGDACEQGVPELEVEKAFLAPKTNLENKIRDKGASASRAIRETAQRYVTLAEDLIRGDTCKQLNEPALRHQRLRLDETMTDAWIARLYELHGSLGRKEDAIVRSGKRAITIGSLIGLFSIVAAMVVAAQVARGVTDPLARLATEAHRVGKGDFSPIPDVGGPLEVVELTRDLDRMRAHLAELDVLKQSFLASVSHELRTPLGKIREALALLGDGTAGTLSERQKSVVAIASRSCETEIRLVSTLLDLSRLRAGTLLQRRPKSSFDDALREAVALERTDGTPRHVSINLEALGSAPNGDLDVPLVERAIANLIRNAVSVSPEGATVEVERVLEGDVARVRVRDHGPGIPEEIRETIFEPFASKEVPGRRGGVGIGLGLAFAREVIRAHNGDIVLSDPTPGNTTFELWMPLR